jgi:ABC-type nitrate/sulfonate/bicarbonate transport system substrate-binding protein
MTTISRRGVVAGGIGALGGLALARALPGRAQEAQTEATLQMGWIANVENAGEFVAAERGYYAAEGVDLELVPGGPGIAVEPIVVAGTALVGLSQPTTSPGRGPRAAP